MLIDTPPVSHFRPRRSRRLNSRHGLLFPPPNVRGGRTLVIRKLPSGKYRLYSRKKDPRTGRRRNLGTFATRAAAAKHERAVQFFKRHG
ncbi:MAG: hypothetical protein AB7M05_03340 [Alphaproteobacteria bacterium]